MSTLDLIGHPPFGRLTVVKRAPNKGRRTAWVCECACGTTGRIVLASNLLGGTSQSCGCLRAERRHRSNFKHGMAKTTEYAIWYGMRQRCLNPSADSYANYGGRGITICERWANSFNAFLADMGPRPGLEYSIERVNNDLGYSKDNCVWDTWHAQNRNRRTNVLLTYNGKTQCAVDWARELHFPEHLVYVRIRWGWTIERALTTPVRERMITLDGRTESLAEWLRLKDMSGTTFRRRLAQGMSAEQALARPVDVRHRKKKA